LEQFSPYKNPPLIISYLNLDKYDLTQALINFNLVYLLFINCNLVLLDLDSATIE
jgi:hypothetical protein